MNRPDIIIADEITYELGRDVAERIVKLRKDNITIWLCSEGGDPGAAFLIAEAMSYKRSIGGKVHVHAVSSAHSSGALIFAFADHRTLAPSDDTDPPYQDGIQQRRRRLNS